MFKLKGVKYKNILNIERLELPPERITCVIGESGSGKTTLLKLLNHLISPDAGEITFGNKQLSQWDPVALRREVVMLSQAPAVFHGTLKDNLLIGLRFSEKPLPDNARLQHALDSVRLHKNLRDEAADLSGGEKQRMALARVMLMNPNVYLLDEPSSALDEETTRFVMERLCEHADASKKTLIMVTHAMAVVHDFAQHVVELAKGGAISIKGEPA